MSLLAFGMSARPAVERAARQRTGLFGRLVGHLIDYRQKQAMEELRRHGLRLPRELEQAGLKINERNEDSLPFVR